MKRKQLARLNHWFCKKRRKPLILRGARQVGKSTLVRLFAEEQGLDLIEINLERHRSLDSLFAEFDVDAILKSIQSITEKKIGEKPLLFLDEIQATPHAIAALRYFYEDRPSLAVIAAGSLMEFTLADHSFSMPVGRVEYLHIGPMTFSEYLQAVDAYTYEEFLAWTWGEDLPLVTHKKLLMHQRHFLLTGGMPEAVDVYRESQSFIEVSEVQGNICNTYLDDFSKYAKNRDLTELQSLFRGIPAHIGRKVKYTALLPEATSLRTKDLLSLLERAQVISLSVKTNANGIPLGAESDPKFRKPIFLDVGLVSHLLGLNVRSLEQARDKALINEGPLAEQFIGQHLFWEYHSQPELYYWARESRKSNADLDYIVNMGGRILPIEVKAGVSGTLKSLHQFMYEKNGIYALRFDLNPPSIQTIATVIKTATGTAEVSYKLVSLPLYAVEKITSFIEPLL
ncbi:MAG: ATP-binding protein [Planctomycetes bacterium]|nr:ATP-binding protein [Planctomycetota bacterium]